MADQTNPQETRKTARLKFTVSIIRDIALEDYDAKNNEELKTKVIEEVRDDASGILDQWQDQESDRIDVELV